MSTVNLHKIHHATLKERFPLTQNGSTKDTWHVTLDLNGQEVDFAPGDSIGIHPHNDPGLVDHLIQAMQATGEEEILHPRTKEKTPLRHFLTKQANLSRLTSSFLKLFASDPKISHLLTPENRIELKEFLTKNDPLFLLRTYAKDKLPLQTLCEQFGPLLPRFYSIASSKFVQPDQIALTIALLTWTQSGEQRYGVASHFLCNLAEMEKTPIPFFVQKARHFYLPEDPHAHVIMIGPGTGIAPFRAFMQERKQLQSKANHWLFFGERNRSSDFFYEEEWKQYPNLRIDTAFSRDQEHKIYVQHRMEEHAEELYRWIEEGAHLYVCGDAEVMAKDVERTLHSIFVTHGKMSEEGAKEALRALKKQGRYCLDVY